MTNTNQKHSQSDTIALETVKAIIHSRATKNTITLLMHARAKEV
ncbi:hypothetical protein T06_12964 [Trichinella sp. T6]|nr:hypothetical protein T06_12964 [Trichinella sp. T6]